MKTIQLFQSISVYDALKNYDRTVIFSKVIAKCYWVIDHVLMKYGLFVQVIAIPQDMKRMLDV